MAIRNMIMFASLLSPLFASAACINEARASCDVYEKCFAEKCNCQGDPDEYIVSFGKHYCESFLGRKDLSEQGMRWRDRTLRCLQERVIEVIPLSGSTCNCKNLKSYALSTHVDCYASQPESVCDLPTSDIVAIGETIVLDRAIFKTMREIDAAAKQVLGVFYMCSNEAKSPEIRELWSNLYRATSILITPLPQSRSIGTVSSNYSDASAMAANTIIRDLPDHPMGHLWAPTNSNRSLHMDIMRGFALGIMKFGNGFFDLGGGVLVKALTGTSISKRPTVLVLAVVGYGRDLSGAVGMLVQNDGLEAPIPYNSKWKIDKSQSYLYWITSKGVTRLSAY